MNESGDKLEEASSLGQLFIAFLRLGSTAFGGPAMVAYIRKMAVEDKHWVDEDTFRNGVALCQTIPGATAIQVAGYVGLRTRGIAGALASFTGFGLPAFIFMAVLSAVYIRTHSLPVVVSAFTGLQAIIVAIVGNAAVVFGRTYLKNWKSVIFALAAASLFGFRIHPIIVILISGIIGLLFKAGQMAPAMKTAPLSSYRNYNIKIIALMVSAAMFFLLLYVSRRDIFVIAILMSRIDIFAFGGGFASVPIMYHEFVDLHPWMDGTTFMDGIVLGQITPGPIYITATFVGYLLKGLTGAIAVTIAAFLPSFIVLVSVAPVFDRLRTSVIFNHTISGIFCSFVGLLLSVTLRFGSNVHWDVILIIMVCGAFVALVKNVDILWVVLAGTVLSLVLL